MSHRPQRHVSENQRRIQLLGILGFTPGKGLSEYARACAIWHFGLRNGSLPSGASPTLIPSWKIAQFICFYAPSRMVSGEIRDGLLREFYLVKEG